MEPLQPTERFTGRASVYARFRPSYPRGAIEALRDRCGLGPGCAVADIGAGTGIFTSLLLHEGATVFAVEPNEEMRSELAASLGDAPNLAVWKGTAEDTHLPSHTIDLVTAAQAFHWFEPESTRREWRRILRAPRWVALVWNTRDVEGDEFHRAYDRLVLDYAKRREGPGTEPAQTRSWTRLGLESELEHLQFPNPRTVDLETLVGNSLSASYVPKPGEVLHPLFVQELTDLFEKCQSNGKLEIRMHTDLFVGSIP